MTQSIYNFYREPPRSDELYHFGVRGMKWGVRRYQNKDGSYTAAGRARRASEEAATAHKLVNKYTNAMDRKAVKRQAQADAIRGTNKTSSAELIRQHQANGRNTARYNPNATAAEKRAVRRSKFLLPGVVPRNQKKPLDVALAERSEKKAAKAQVRADRAKAEAATAHKLADKYTSAMDAKAAKRQAQAENSRGLSDSQKTALKVGSRVVAATIFAYGTYKLAKSTPGGQAAINAGKAAVSSAMRKTASKAASGVSSAAKSAGRELVRSAKAAPGEAWKAAKSGARTGVNDAAKVAAAGATIYATQKAFERKYGKEEAQKIIGYGRQPRKKK